MKKKWLALGLAAMMSLGCLFACGDGDDDDSGNEENNETEQTVIGEQVTKEQWDTAFDNIDFTYAVKEWREFHKDKEGDEKEVWVGEIIEKEIFLGTNYYERRYDLEDAILGVTDGDLSIEEHWYIRAENGGSYKYSKTEEDDEGEVVWSRVDYNKEFDEDNVQYGMWNFVGLPNLLKYDSSKPDDRPWENYESVFEQEIEEFAFDATTGVYHQDWQDEYEDEEEKCVEKERLEVTFLDGKVYSIKGIYIEDYIYEDGGTEYWEASYTVTFKKEVIPVPGDEEALRDEEAVLNMWETYSGTYKFESLIVDGVTYKVGDTYMDLTLTEDYSVVELREDGTATHSIMGEVLITYFAWWIEDGNLIVSNGGKENRGINEFKDNKIISHGSEASTCWKKYN